MRWISLALMAALVASAAMLNAQEIRKSAEFSPVRMSENDLLDLLGKIRSIAVRANGPVDPKRGPQEELSVEDGLTSLKLTHGIDASALSTAPPAIYSVDYTYEDFEGKAISSVELRFTDYRRTIAVRGESREQVEALFSLLSENVTTFENRFGGGAMFRAVAAPFLLTAGVAIMLLSLRASEWRNRVPISIVGLLIVLSVFLLPWEKLLPGTAIYSDNASILVRQGPLISFAGFVVSTVAFVASLFWQFSHTNPPPLAPKKISEQRSRKERRPR